MNKVLIFAEDQNDAHALKIIIKNLLPDWAISVRRDPVILSRGASRLKLERMSSRIALFEKAEARSGHKIIVVAHRDCDACEPAHDIESAHLEANLKTAGIARPVAATPAWEIEAWWMLIPEALSAVRGCWRVVDYGKRQVGKIENAKETLISALRPTGKAAKRCPDYTEADSVRIAEEAVRLGLVSTRLVSSASFAKFKNSLESASK